MATVELCAVSKKYGQNTILHALDLKVEKGEFIVVMGPSGCGKSTLLRLVTGLESLTSGTILINNESINKIAPAKRDMAMVFQHYALYPHMTAYDNMAYGLKMRGMKKNDIAARVFEAAEILNLTPFLKYKPQALSGGQNQRVAMGRAIVRQPAVFLFDEPLSHLDAKLRTTMRYEIKKLHEKLKTTSLYVTHDQTEAMTLASRVVVLNKGKIEQIATPKDLYQKPASLFVAEFGGQYPMNFFPAKIDYSQNTLFISEGFSLPLPKLDCQSRVVDVLVGIRPEHMQLTKAKKNNSIAVRVEFVDDLGTDKMVQLSSLSTEHRFSVRMPAEVEMPEYGYMHWLGTKAHVFALDTGLRLGGWYD